MQDLIVALIVTACTVYAAWVLMPSVLRRTLALRLQRWPWPAFVARRVHRATLAPTGCDCDAGCDAKAAQPAQAQPIRFHRRPGA